MCGVVAFAGCEAAPASPPTDPELRAELGIADDVSILRIDLAGREDDVRVVPAETDIAPGDVVQVVALDHRVYLIAFDTSGLGAAELAFLRSSGQESPPPLVERGARLVLTFEGAPAGRYPFTVETGGAEAAGIIRVEAR